MGSKRDGVRVPWEKHGVRPSRRVRAAARVGALPTQREVPKHYKRSRGRKPWRLMAQYEGTSEWQLVPYRTYATESAAEDAAICVLGMRRPGRTPIKKVKVVFVP